MDSESPSHKGKWKIIEPRFKHLPVHIALFHTGKVLAFGGSGNDPDKLKKLDNPQIFEPDYTGQTDGTVREITKKGIEGDIFCAGHAFLPDGKLFVTGGTFLYDGLFGKPIPLNPFFWGLEHTYIFDPDKLSWTRVKNMRHGRWYPTCVMIPDGRIATFAGLTKLPPWVILPFQEIYSEKEDKWEYIKGANKFFPLYPRIHLLPDGELFYAGSYNTHLTFPFSLWGFNIAKFSFTKKRWKKLPHPKNLHRQEGSTVLLPLLPEDDYNAKIILIGGGDTVGNHATETVEMIDFSDETPQYRPIASMKNKRFYVYPVILPDQNILAVGGKTGHGGHSLVHKCIEEKQGELKHDQDAVLDTEIFLTKEKPPRWDTLSPMKVDRLYHSNAILLPDGCVMTAGSNPMRKCEEQRIEMFSPPYLFRGERPSISNCPKQLNYGQSFEIESQYAGDIKSVSLIRPSNTTHCLNPEQRYVGLEFEEKNSNKLFAKIPTNRNVLPPGYYMLFIVNKKDVPCIAPFVRILI